jgi:hypothetical protein
MAKFTVLKYGVIKWQKKLFMQNQDQQKRCDYMRIEKKPNPSPNCFRFHLA